MAYNGVALCVAAAHGKIEMVKLLIERNADPAVRNNEPLCSAAENGHVGVVAYLVELAGVDVSAREYAAYKLADKHHHLLVMKVLEPWMKVNVAKKEEKKTENLEMKNPEEEDHFEGLKYPEED